MRQAFTLIELLVVIVIILVLCTCLVGPGGIEGLLALAIGWVRYPLRLAQEREVNWSSALLCGACLIGLTIGTHYFGRWFAATRPEPAVWPWSRSFKLIGLVLLMFFAGIVGIGITHEIVWLATTKDNLTEGGTYRVAAARAHSTNNLKQMGIAAHNHQDKQESLPAGATFDATGRGMHGWQTFLLPYIEQEALYRQIDLSLPWNHPKNAGPMGSAVPIYFSPIGDTERIDGYGVSGYAGNLHVLGARPMTLKDISDGASNTILFGEASHELKPWGMPMNCRDPSVGLNVPAGFGARHGKVVPFALADGSVRAIRADINPDVLKALGTPRAGDKFDESDLDR